MGGAKGGSDFDPKGKSDAEVRRFCQAFMTELLRHIGQFTDVPAGDIGVGKREIGYLFGQYKRITNQFTGVITGKGADWGGSLIRPEATGYGVVYFAAEMLATRGDSLEGKRCLVSGSGNVAQYTMQKLIDLGAVPITMSDSDGFVVDPDGIDEDKLTWVMGLKNVRRGRIREYAERFPRATYVSATDNAGGHGIWDVPADCAFPCATQNEIGEVDAANLVRNGVGLVTEGANMPVTLEGVERLRAADVPLRAGHGRQRRRGDGLGARDDPGRRAPALDARAGRQAPARDHASDPHARCARRRRLTASPTTTWPAPTSPASPRWPTPCSTRGRSEWAREDRRRDDRSRHVVVAGAGTGGEGAQAGALRLLSSIVIGVASTAPAYSLAATIGLIAAVVGVLTPAGRPPGVHPDAVRLGRLQRAEQGRPGLRDDVHLGDEDVRAHHGVARGLGDHRRRRAGHGQPGPGHRPVRVLPVQRQRDRRRTPRAAGSCSSACSSSWS